MTPLLGQRRGPTAITIPKSNQNKSAARARARRRLAVREKTTESRSTRPATPFLFGLIERCVGAGGETVQRHAIPRRQRDADGAADAHFVTVDHIGSAWASVRPR